jgi:hypothetical protein
MQGGKMQSRKTTTSTLSLKKFQAQMQDLRNEIANLTGENVQEGQQEPARTEYYTDEELAKETEWIVQHKRKEKKSTACNAPKQPNSERSISPNMKWINP